MTILNRLSILTILTAALCCGQTHGATPAAPPLVFAFSQLEPFKTTDGVHYGGAYTEIVRELVRRAGYQLQILACPLKRCLLMLEQGDADIIIGIQESPERARYLHYLKTAYRKRGSDKVFYVRKGKGQAIRSYEDLRPLRIGVKHGAANFARFEADTGLIKVAARDVATNFRKLALDRVDAVIVAEDQGEAILSQLKLRGQLEKTAYRYVDTAAHRAIGVGKNSVNATTIKALEAAMADMVRDGTVTELFRRHYFETYQIPANSVPGL